MKNTEPEKLIREFLVSKFSEDDSYAHDDTKRPLHMAATYSRYGFLSTLIIEVQGSPPRGLMVLRFDEIGRMIYCAVEIWNGSNHCLRRTKLKAEIDEAVRKLIVERGIPFFKIERRETQ